MKLRGYFALVILCVSFPFFDLFQRLVLTLWVTALPSRRIPALGRWMQFMASYVFWTVTRVGGAKLQLPPRVVPARPGTLVVMNHQSLLDIPLAVSAMAEEGYPRIVTRARYRRFIPLISHMVRLYQYPVVDPTANPGEVRESLEILGREGAASELPIAIFPEGTRTKNGEVGRFRTRGLRVLLQERSWTVYLFVADGYWRTAKLKHFLEGMSHIDGRIEHLGIMEWTNPSDDPEAFIDEMRRRIVDGLGALRDGVTEP